LMRSRLMESERFHDILHRLWGARVWVASSVLVLCRKFGKSDPITLHYIALHYCCTIVVQLLDLATRKVALVIRVLGQEPGAHYNIHLVQAKGDPHPVMRYWHNVPCRVHTHQGVAQREPRQTTTLASLWWLAMHCGPLGCGGCNIRGWLVVACHHFCIWHTTAGRSWVSVGARNSSGIRCTHGFGVGTSGAGI
jgi:hypothetical protein